MATKITKSELKSYIKEILHEELTEARSKKNPPAPTTIKVIKVEPDIQSASGVGAKWRHYDIITYIDPIGGFEDRRMVFEEKPGFGRYFVWGDQHSVDGWAYAAYDYNGNLLPDIDPSATISPTAKKVISGLVDKINNPGDFD
jgi:hypothetical protein